MYQDIRDNSIHEILQSMNEEHCAFANDGFELQRIYVNPGVGTDTKLDPFSSKDFIRATGKTKDNIGSLFDRAKEMSLKREDKIINHRKNNTTDNCYNFNYAKYFFK